MFTLFSPAAGTRTTIWWISYFLYRSLARTPNCKLIGIASKKINTLYQGLFFCDIKKNTKNLQENPLKVKTTWWDYFQACKLAGARRITAVLPLLPYARWTQFVNELQCGVQHFVWARKKRSITILPNIVDLLLSWDLDFFSGGTWSSLIRGNQLVILFHIQIFAVSSIEIHNIEFAKGLKVVADIKNSWNKKKILKQKNISAPGPLSSIYSSAAKMIAAMLETSGVNQVRYFSKCSTFSFW